MRDLAKRPMMEQDWNHVLFLHWKVEPSLLREHVPFELDLFEGAAVLSIVPFQMSRIRFPPLPVFPFVSQLWELNLRTYVTVNGIRGVYFFTLDTDSRLGTWVANRFFHLPYRVAQMTGRVSNGHYQLQSQRAHFSFNLCATVSTELKLKSKLDHWATDREHLFTKKSNRIYRGTVLHEEWPLAPVQILDIEDRFSSQLSVQLPHLPDESSYSRHLRVRFLPFEIGKVLA